MNNISFFQLIKEIIKKSFSLSGREPKESILVYLFFLVFIEISLFGLYQFINLKPGYQIILCFLPLLPLPALFVRRIHDHNKNLGFTLLPFILFLLLLPFLNFKAFTPNALNEKLVLGGIIIEIISVLFLIQLFLFLIFLFSKGNKNENLYGQPFAYLPPKIKKSHFIFFCALFICLFFFILSQTKKEEKFLKSSPMEVKLEKINHSFKQEKKQPIAPKKRKVLKQIKFDEPREITQNQTKFISPSNSFNELENEIKINDILNFLFNMSIKSIKEEKEFSYSLNAPKEILFLNAKKGDILFIMKEKSLLPLIQKQQIKCKKEVCLFKYRSYLKTIN